MEDSILVLAELGVKELFCRVGRPWCPTTQRWRQGPVQECARIDRDGQREGR